MKATAIILAGGKSARMHYKDKAWINYKGSPLITHVIKRLVPQVTRTLISRNNYDPRYETLPYPCIADLNTYKEGPLAGILACSYHVETPLTLVVPCDTPNLPLDLFKRLSLDLDHYDVSIPTCADGEQPLMMLAKTPVLSEIDGNLKEGKRSVKDWLSKMNVQKVQFSSSSNFENINYPSQIR